MLKASLLLLKVFFLPFDLLLAKANFIIIYRFDAGIGDNLGMTAFIREFNIAYPKTRIIVLSDKLFIFENSPRIFKKWALSALPKSFKRSFLKIVRLADMRRFKEFACPQTKNVKLEDRMRTDESLKTKHLAEVASMHIPFPLEWKQAKCEFFFSEHEKINFAKKYSFLPKNYAVLQSQGTTAYTPNKEWGVENMQEVVHLTKEKIHWVQVGGLFDEPLVDVIDLRQATFREAAFVGAGSKFVLSQEGAWTHLSNALNKNSITIQTGFAQISYTDHSKNHPITSNDPPPCAPCWLLTPCPYNMKCATSITPYRVAEYLTNANNQLI